MMRQIAGAFHQYEKAPLVAKLKAARDRKRAAGGKTEGRKRWVEINPELVQAAKRLRGTSRRPDKPLRDIAAALAELGDVNERGAGVLAAFDPVDAQFAPVGLARRPGIDAPARHRRSFHAAKTHSGHQLWLRIM
jgi:hypothetical protein